MAFGWATRFPRDSLGAALPLRLRAGVEAHDDGAAVWLRGAGAADDAVVAALRRVPAAERFTVDAAGELTPDGRRLPAGTLPAGPWVAFAELARLRLPPAALAAEVSGRVSVRLVPAEREREVGGLLVPLDRFATWAATAARVRLDRLRFAVRADGMALVVGRPPPPVPGVALVDRDGLLVPAGWDWDPPVDADTLRLAVGLAAGDVALFDTGGIHERVPGESLVGATRAGVRRSAEAVD